MEQIVLNEMNSLNGAAPNKDTNINDLDVWTDCIEDAGNIQGKQLSGVMSQLVQKGLIRSFGKGREATTQVTKDGLVSYLENKEGKK